MIKQEFLRKVCSYALAAMPITLNAAEWTQWAESGTYAIQYVGDMSHVNGYYLANPLALGGQDWSDVMLVSSYDYVASAWNINDEKSGNISVRNTQGGKNSGDLIIFKSQIRTSNNANFVTYLKNQTFRMWTSGNDESGAAICTVLSNYEDGRYWTPSPAAATLSFTTATYETAAQFRFIPLYNHEPMLTWVLRSDSILNDAEKSYPAEKRALLTACRDEVSSMLNRLDNTREATEAALSRLRDAFGQFESSGTSGAVTSVSDLTPYERANKVSLTVSGHITIADLCIIRDEMFCLKQLDLSATDLSELPDYAFSGCGMLTEVKLPASCTRIGDCAFLSCASLTESPISEQITAIGNLAFCHSGLTQVTIPAGTTAIGQYAFEGCKALEFITVDDSNRHYASLEGVLYDKEYSVLIKCPQARSGQLVLPETVKTIAPSACLNCTALNGTLTLPAGLESVGSHAFENCPGLAGTLVIPANVKELGDGSFWGCYGFTGELLLSESLCRIGDNAFAYGSQLKKIKLPATMETLREGVFMHCDRVEHIVSPRENAPVVESYALYAIDRDRTYIEVPQESKAAYQQAAVWKEFLNYDGLVEQPARFTQSGKYYIHYIGEGTNRNKFIGFDTQYGAKAPLVSIDKAACWDLEFFWVSSTTSPVKGGEGTDIRFADGTSYNHINMSGDCYQDKINGYAVNDNRTFAFWLQPDATDKNRIIAIQGNGTYWLADNSKAAIATEKRTAAPRTQDFVFRLMTEDEIGNALKIELLKATVDLSAYKAYLDALAVGEGTWQLPVDEQALKTNLQERIGELEELLGSDATDYDAFSEAVGKCRSRIEECMAAIEAAINRPQEYEMPVGLCFHLVCATNGKKLMRSGSVQWKQFCTTFEEEGTVIAIGENANNVPGEITVSPAEFIVKWDENNKNYYLYEPTAQNALRLNDGFLAKSLPGGSDYASKARIAAFHRATDGTYNIQGTAGGYTNEGYFSEQINVTTDVRKATCWQLNVLRRIIESGEASETLEDSDIPVEMHEGAQMTGAEGRNYSHVTLMKKLKGGRWYAVSLPGETAVVLREETDDHQAGDTLGIDDGMEVMTYQAGRFAPQALPTDKQIPAGTYVIRVKSDMSLAFMMKNVSFIPATAETRPSTFMGSGSAANVDNVNAYTMNEEGTAFVYAPLQSISPFEGYITASAAGEHQPIAIPEIAVGIDGLAEGIEFEVRNHRLNVYGTDDYELYHLSGTRVSDKKAEQVPGVYVLVVGNKTLTLLL